MLSKVTREALFAKRAAAVQAFNRRAFSNQVEVRDEGVLDHVRQINVVKASTLSQADMSRYITSIHEREKTKKKEYLEMLNDTQARQKYFSRIAEPNSQDHEEISRIKDKINHLIHEEIELAGFKDKLSQEEMQALRSDTYKEVATNSNYYFSYDANKKDKNIAVFNFEAPGNKYRHPNVILPHEHVDVSHFIDTKDLTEDKLFEIYGYYSLLIDMHIAQIRPGNVDGVSYIPPHMNQVAPTFTNPIHLNNMFFEHFHRWREPTRAELNIEKRWKQ